MDPRLSRQGRNTDRRRTVPIDLPHAEPEQHPDPARDDAAASRSEFRWDNVPLHRLPPAPYAGSYQNMNFNAIPIGRATLLPPLPREPTQDPPRATFKQTSTVSRSELVK